MSGLTFAQRVLSEHVDDELVPDGIVFADVDLMMATDGTLPLAAVQFEKMGASVAHPERIVLVQDHYVPAKDIVSANASRTTRLFARQHQVGHHFEVGRGGICHHVLPDAGLCFPGDLIIGADSHTCTYGAFGAFACGVGSTDFAFAMATGKLWFRVPRSIRVNLHGSKRAHVLGKDVALYLLSRLRLDGANYKFVEFAGEGVASLAISDRITLCNMTAEVGAKGGIFAVDAITREFLSRFPQRAIRDIGADRDAEYDSVIDIDLTTIPTLIAEPWSPDNVAAADSIERRRIRIDQVFIGSCTNGRLEDMEYAASILAGRTVHEEVRLIVTPGTQEIYRTMAQNGVLERLLQAGATVTPATCGACVGGHMGILGDNEVCLSTSNRNFVGRMGARTAQVYLCNPYVAAASAVKGYICTPEAL